MPASSPVLMLGTDHADPSEQRPSASWVSACLAKHPPASQDPHPQEGEGP